jgi:cell division septation protein DedD
LPAPETAAPGATAPIAAGLGSGSSAPGTAPAPAPASTPSKEPPGAGTPANQSLGTSAPLTAAPPADGKRYRVHVASFRSEEKVAPIVRDLRLKGLDAWYEPVSDGSGWYRVFVGRFATEDEAAAYASWLLRNKWVDRAHAFPSTSR